MDEATKYPSPGGEIDEAVKYPSPYATWIKLI